MTRVVSLPASKQTFRELNRSCLEIVTPGGAVEVAETHGLLVEGISRRSTRLAPVSVAFGATPDGSLPRISTVLTVARPWRARRQAQSLTIALVGTSHWVVELVGNFSQLTVQHGDESWTEELSVG